MPSCTHVLKMEVCVRWKWAAWTLEAAHGVVKSYNKIEETHNKICSK